MAKDRLTPRQMKFCELYAANPNATEAAKQAGYKENTASVMGYENLRKPQIVAYLQELGAGVDKARIATAQERKEWWTKVLRGEEPDADMKDRLKASELLGKSQADFIERQEITGDLKITEIRRTIVDAENG